MGESAGESVGGSLFDARSFDDPPDASPTPMERAGGSSEELLGWDDEAGDYDHA